jgi:hypothetical protein
MMSFVVAAPGVEFVGEGVVPGAGEVDDDDELET